MTTRDRALVEDAVRMLASAAPQGWSRLAAEFDFSSLPVSGQASVTCGGQLLPIPVPSEAVGLIAEYQRRTSASGGAGRRVVIAADDSGTLTLHTDDTPGPSGIASAQGGPHTGVALRTGESAAARATQQVSDMSLLTWTVIAAVAAALLVWVAINPPERPTLRAIAASESMTDEQAVEVADSTVRLWLRERNTFNVANFDALTCPGKVLQDREGARRHVKTETDAVRVTWGLTRDGPQWKLSVDFTDGKDAIVVMRIIDGGLRVCGFETPPTHF